MACQRQDIRSSIKARLIKSFTVAILIPSLVTAVVGVLDDPDTDLRPGPGPRHIRSRIGQRDLSATTLERLKDSLRIHATRMIVYGALERNDPAGLVAEMERIRNAERLDILTLTDASGKVFYRTCNPALVGDDQRSDVICASTCCRKRSPVSSTDIVRTRRTAQGIAERWRIRL